MKSMKLLLTKTVGTHRLTNEELITILTEAEAVMNSHTLTPLDSAPTDGVPGLTPGHTLIGSPLLSLPERVDTDEQLSSHKRWNVCQLLSAGLWRRWSREYIHLLNQDAKWKKIQRDLVPGDVVLLKDQEAFQRSWPLAKILKTNPWPDGPVRVATVQTEKSTCQ